MRCFPTRNGDADDHLFWCVDHAPLPNSTSNSGARLAGFFLTQLTCCWFGVLFCACFTRVRASSNRGISASTNRGNRNPRPVTLEPTFVGSMISPTLAAACVPTGRSVELWTRTRLGQTRD